MSIDPRFWPGMGLCGVDQWISRYRLLARQDGLGGPYYGLWAFDPVQNAWSLLTPLDSNGQPFSLEPQTVEHIIEREGNESAAWNLCGRDCAVLATDWWSLARH